MIAIGLAVDTGRPVVLAIVIPIAVAVLAALTGAMIFGAYRRARVRSSELLGARGAASIVGLVWLVVGVTSAPVSRCAPPGRRSPSRSRPQSAA